MNPGILLLFIATIIIAALWVITSAVVSAIMLGVCAVTTRIQRHLHKLVAADNTQLAADQERHGEAPCPPYDESFLLHVRENERA